MTLHGKNIIGNRLSAEGRETFRAVAPALDDQVEPPFFEATAEEVQQALELAHRAFCDCRPEAAQTASLLERIADEIEAVGEALIELLREGWDEPPLAVSPVAPTDGAEAGERAGDSR